MNEQTPIACAEQESFIESLVWVERLYAESMRAEIELAVRLAFEQEDEGWSW
ncbi:MAG: hypothetical protein JXR96_12845 [Deltaproteobacteria bacterium]|nr:hypothetical protein [Deltaproteobacteria bacterium]